MLETPSYIKSLVKPSANKSNARKVWSIDLETVWLPFFNATNAMKVTSIDAEALGAPLRLAYNQDNTVKFSKSGKPVIRVAKPLSNAVKNVRDNFIAGLQSYAHEVAENNAEAFNQTVRDNIEAGKPIIEHDKEMLNQALDNIVKAGIEHAESAEAEAEAKIKAEAEAELIPA